MLDYLNHKSPFLQKVVAIIQDNLGDEHFGVTELAEALNMSRSNLLRKVKQEIGESVSVFIRNVRLQNALQLLKESELTVSEISFRVGFSSTSYFTKCFRELYGHTPGDTSKINIERDLSETSNPDSQKSLRLKRPILVGIVILSIVAIALLVIYYQKNNTPSKLLAKSVAVLPFKNDSADSTNVYFMNGLMEAILDNFQKIEDLKVTSRTTSEKYRNDLKSIPELSRELNVNYFVEGSGQKIGDEIVLTIQLIEGPSDKHLWSKRYKRELNDVFALQADVAKSIAAEINAVITPKEQERIEKVPTNNLVAYDYYLKGLTLLNDDTGNGLKEGIVQFKKAIQEDGEFANAYAYIAISYYYLDLFREEKQHTEEIKNYADKAMLLDADLGESLIANSLYFMQIKDFRKAEEALLEVLEYYPNVAWIHNFLSDIYAYMLPNTKKYLIHALQGIEVAISDKDSVSASITYLHLSNALAQTGFLDEAEKYIKKSKAYNPQNHYSKYLHEYIKLGQHNDLRQTKFALIEIFNQDTTKIDVISEVAKVCYTLEEYEEAWFYYEKLISIRYALKLDIYHNYDLNMAFVLEQLGREQEAKSFYESYLAFAEKDQSIYQELTMAAYFAAKGDIEKGMNGLKAFSKQDNYQYWFVLFLDKDPILLKMKNHPDFQNTVQKIRTKFWENHKEIKKMLVDKDIVRM
ncbi:helix-turn-helix domain-containing protein [Marivirga harenae]|uniref:helix-turn-helix domain-containing protein n=1 Tax=Marivirga harenae TaxID=2010992 RepID=UPI0026DFE0AD|nr:helix-turn-helix domain-containing protein [Marivirga harenae]WKV10617.1 helix-turn-helix domain-containing protein [Marivirga harenae]|tara:strand:+ start:587865 stop:589943 length:2079 start_codon:yes stop_codon:yes gene_type:complete